MSRISAGAIVLAFAIVAQGVAAHAAELAPQTPAEALARRPNNLALLPDRWIETKPIQLTEQRRGE